MAIHSSSVFTKAKQSFFSTFRNYFLIAKRCYYISDISKKLNNTANQPCQLAFHSIFCVTAVAVRGVKPGLTNFSWYIYYANIF